MATYFITGGLGFLGQYIVQAVHEHDPRAEIRVLVRTKHATFLPIQELEGVRWVHGDLLLPETYTSALEGVDAIIHNAAMVSFRRSEAEQVHRANVLGTRMLAETARRIGCPNFVFISSISAVKSQPGRVADETMYPDLELKRKSDAYGYSKLVSEAELKRMTSQMRVVILNPSVVLGPGSDRIEMVTRAVRFLPVLPMLQYTNSFVDVRDVARAAVLALTKGRSGERYIVTAWNIGMVEFTRKLLQVIGKKAMVVPVSGPAVRLFDGLLWALDLLKMNPGIRRLTEMNIDKACSWEKIHREMGWEPGLSLEQSIADSFQAWKKAE